MINRGTLIAGTAVAGSIGYAMGCWLARATSAGTRRESALLPPAGFHPGPQAGVLPLVGPAA